jgi:hypothetical protein
VTDQRGRGSGSGVFAMNSQSPRRRRLALEITLVLMIKMAALATIWHVWFSDPEDRRIDAERVGAKIYSSSAATQ